MFVIFQGFFAASEISFISCNAIRLRNRQAKGDRRARRVYELIMNPEKFLVTTLVGTNISVVLSTSLITFFLLRQGVKSSNLWITFIFTPFVVIFAELIPKNVGRIFREDFSSLAVDFIDFFERLFLPLIKIIEILNNFLIRLFIKKSRHRSPFVTKEEIKSLVKDIQSQGGIDRGEKEAIEEVFEFRSDKIRDNCVKIQKVVAIDCSDSLKKIMEVISKTGFTRYPVYRDKKIAGYINIYELFYNPKDSWQSFIRPITKIGFNQRVYEAFKLLQSKKESIALVIKGKKIYGIITVSDVVGEVIGSILQA